VGDAASRISPSVDPGTVPLAEMHRNIFTLVSVPEASLFPSRAATRHPWPLAGIVTVLSAQWRGWKENQRSCRYQGTGLIFSDI